MFLLETFCCRRTGTSNGAAKARRAEIALAAARLRNSEVEEAAEANEPSSASNTDGDSSDASDNESVGMAAKEAAKLNEAAMRSTPSSSSLQGKKVEVSVVAPDNKSGSESPAKARKTITFGGLVSGLPKFGHTKSQHAASDDERAPLPATAMSFTCAKSTRDAPKEDVGRASSSPTLQAPSTRSVTTRVTMQPRPSGLRAGSKEAPAGPPSPRSAQAGKDVQKTVQALRLIAMQVEASCQKYPKTGKGLFASAQDRFLAAVPMEGGSTSESWDAEFERWRRGRLAYWSNRQSYMSREEPKGHIDLVSIAKVSRDKGSPKEVCVRYREDGEVFQLIVRFPDADAAETWSAALFHLRQLIDKTMPTDH